MIRSETAHSPSASGIAARAIAARNGTPFDANSLPSLVQRAASQLASATSAAEVLEARDAASVAYDASKKAARLARAKGAHDELIAKAHRAQADALEIEATAKRRLADEYDAAQERGEVASQGKPSALEGYATAADIGLTHKDIHEARQIRDAEQADPGIVRRTLDARLAEGDEPTKAALREAVIEAARQGFRGNGSSSRKNPQYVNDTNFQLMLEVVGPCRAVMEKVTAGTITPAIVISGLLDDQMRARNIVHMQRFRDFLNLVLETANAE
jgi:hypothetical protein